MPFKDPEAARAYVKRWRRENKDAIKERAKGRRRLVKLGVVPPTAYQIRRAAQCREAAKRSALRRRYGLTVDEFLALIVEQDNRCAICRHELRRVNVDHDHATGRRRALLCSRCNTRLSALEDVDWRHRAEEYLARWR